MNRTERLTLFILMYQELIRLCKEALNQNDYELYCYYSDKQVDLIDAAYDVAEDVDEVERISHTIMGLIVRKL